MKYDFRKIERRWQAEWAKKKIYEPDLKKAKRPFYNLMMFPYPSAEGLHVGNMYAFTGSDVYGRFKRMQGYDVFEPIGLDGFGIHSENYAIKIGAHPMKQASVSEKRFYEQLRTIGNGFAWNERLETYDPEYYKWTQWIFVQMFKHGLAYRKKQAVNWCPSCKTVLADEQVIAGKCERCSTVVIKKELEQWFFKITDYADRLLKNLKKLDWAERVKIAQRNWIGRSEGAEIDFPVAFENKPNFLILHGYTGKASKNFIPWLKRKLEKEGYTVQAPELPNTDDPKEGEQVKYVLKNCRMDKDTVIVGHSLGGVVAMKVLLSHKRPVGGLVLIASAIDPASPGAKERPFWKHFSWKDIGYKKLKKMAKFRVVLSDLKEAKKRAAYLENLSRKIGGQLITGYAQKEHFTDKEEPGIFESLVPKIKVFTTRPDTLFGATYMVLAPEHPLVGNLKAQISNVKEVEAYVKKAKGKSEEERIAEGQVKTGVELKGVKAINPATKEEIPVWVADYVLATYGTGAIMAVPAHDERDFEFAKKYKLPIKQVIAPHFEDEKSKRQPGYPLVKRRSVNCILRNPKTNEYLTLDWGKFGWHTFVIGGIEEDEDPVKAAKRAIMEETGYRNIRFVRKLGRSYGSYFAAHKKENRLADAEGLLFELINSSRAHVGDQEHELHTSQWMKLEEVETFIEISSQRYIWEQFKNESAYVGEGFVVDSGKFSGMQSEKAKWAIAKFVAGRRKVQYRLRDWLISRQRYWGPPIPMIHCGTCEKAGKGERSEMPGWYAVPEKNLPVRLPFVKDFRPKGKSPLASVRSFYDAACPRCGAKARRETDVSDTFLDSAWYYIGYLILKSQGLRIKDQRFAWDRNILKRWLPVNAYIGGAEHAVLHLLYSRFLAMALHDMKYVHFNEPFAKFRAHGLLIREGAKMSKSKGNIVNPDEFIEKFGADALRLHLMFAGPFEEGGDFRDAGIMGPTRFLERVWKLMHESGTRNYKSGEDKRFTRILHQTVKKVGEDVEGLRYNTAISALMVLLNEMEKHKSQMSTRSTSSGLMVSEVEPSKVTCQMFLKLLAPFAPHLTDELWQQVRGLTQKKRRQTQTRFLRTSASSQRTSAFRSIHREPWPTYNPNILKEETFTLVIQINGRVRDSLEAPADIGAKEAEKLALARERIQQFLGSEKPKKVIYVPGRLINIVV